MNIKDGAVLRVSGIVKTFMKIHNKRHKINSRFDRFFLLVL